MNYCSTFIGNSLPPSVTVRLWNLADV